MFLLRILKTRVFSGPNFSTSLDIIYWVHFYYFLPKDFKFNEFISGEKINRGPWERNLLGQC